MTRQMENSEQTRNSLQLSLFGGMGVSQMLDIPGPMSTDTADSDESALSFDTDPNNRPWSQRELEAWKPPDHSLVSDFAASDRYLSSDFSAFEGKWTHKAFYAIEPMDAFVDPLLEELTLMAAAQSVKTEIAHNQLGYAIKNDPAPALVVMPSIKTTGTVNERIKSMIIGSPELARHLTGKEDDVSSRKIKLDNMPIYFATAGSDADLRNVLARYLLLDETDGYPLTTEKGKQGSPIGQARARATTYWNRKIIKSCTPTVESGYINQEYQRSDRRQYWMPCPHCLGYQVLKFKQLKHVGCKLGEWPKDKREEDYILSNSVARYECEYCGEEIEERDKPWMDRMGTWVPDGHRIERDGTVEFPVQRTRHRGYRWSAIISPFVTWHQMMAEFFKTKDNPGDYQNFVNLFLGEIWQEATVKKDESEILALRTERPPLIVPAGTVALTAGVDNQKHGKWVVVRAWIRDGRAIESHLVRYGFVESFDELEQWIFEDVYPVEGSDIVLPVWRGGIDIGGSDTDGFQDETMTETVYDWLRKSGRGVMFGIKGSSRVLGGGKKMRSSIIDRMPSRPGKQGLPIPGGLKLWLLDTDLIKKAVWSRIESGKFHIHSEAEGTYAKHMTAEVREKQQNGRIMWVVKNHRANHLFDAEVYAAAMADPECDGGVMVLRDPSDTSFHARQLVPTDTPMGRAQQILRNRTVNPASR